MPTTIIITWTPTKKSGSASWCQTRPWYLIHTSTLLLQPNPRTCKQCHEKIADCYRCAKRIQTTGSHVVRLSRSDGVYENPTRNSPPHTIACSIFPTKLDQYFRGHRCANTESQPGDAMEAIGYFWPNSCHFQVTLLLLALNYRLE